MTVLNKKDRVLKTLDLEEPDVVPICEIDMELPIIEAITGRTSPVAGSGRTDPAANRKLEEMRVLLRLDCYKKLGFELFVINLSNPDHLTSEMRPDGTIVDLWGKVLVLDKQRKAWVPCGTIFNTPEDFEDFDFPDPNESGWTFTTEQSKRFHDDTMALATVIRDPFANAWEMFTPQKFVLWMYQKPDFIKRVIERLTDFNTKIIDRVVEAGADLIISAGDYSEEKGPMVPPKFFTEVVFPNLQRQVCAAHRHGLKFVKHSDGNLNPILNELASIVDGLHSLDPSANMNIGEIKARYGDRLVLMGNIAVDNLANRCESEVTMETRECIRVASPGGGHILSSSNSWAAGAKLANCLAMVKAGRKYGKYPIRV